MGQHNIVMTYLLKRQIDPSQAAAVAEQIVFTFPLIKFSLLVGIGGNVPTKVRLGDVVLADERGHEPLFTAINSGNVEAAAALLEIDSARNPSKSAQQSMLTLAIKKGHEAMSNFLLDHGAHSDHEDEDGQVLCVWLQSRGF
ncbi:hypothetical protein POX_f08396 [Penicillium oxalicum]|uniref:hypothetical protein n=1 Tax=Penicillium oxalicum TaxID=69781 RepID=UPI0020B8F557|nr:hypothetical protein POX_f08396 [Penicillium oxalicum]KAI2788013.1 hypothetical protein POX_f08396 [Penicillium oxalicum]